MIGDTAYYQVAGALGAVPAARRQVHQDPVPTASGNPVRRRDRRAEGRRPAPGRPGQAAVAPDQGAPTRSAATRLLPRVDGRDRRPGEGARPRPRPSTATSRSTCGRARATTVRPNSAFSRRVARPRHVRDGVRHQVRRPGLGDRPAGRPDRPVARPGSDPSRRGPGPRPGPLDFAAAGRIRLRLGEGPRPDQNAVPSPTPRRRAGCMTDDAPTGEGTLFADVTERGASVDPA